MTFKSFVAAAGVALVGFGSSAQAAGPSLPHLAPLTVKSDVEQARWRGDRYGGDRYGHDRRRGGHSDRGRCVAVGVTINGRSIPGVYGVGFGHGACREALSECRFDLRRRQYSGRNPFGRCVVAG